MTHLFTRSPNKAKSIFPRHSVLAASVPSLGYALTLTIVLNLTGCGDAGPTPTSSLIQGRWASTALTPAYIAVVVPASTGANTPAVDTVWALAQDASSLIKLKANGASQTAGAVTGSVYTLGSASVTPISGGSYTVISTAATPTSAAVQQFSIQPLLGTTALFERADAMSTALTAAQANGTWQADLGVAKVNWTVDTAAPNVNNLSGTSTTGCTYSGQSTVVSTQSLYKIQFTETCSGGTIPVVQNFTGMATISPDNTRLTVVGTNESETRATALLFVKQP
jgi:hypothetical protein